MSDEEPFGLPFPPHFPAPPGGEGDVIFVRRRRRAPDPGAEGERDSEDIMLRNVPRPVGQRFRAAAGARGLTHAQYLSALVALHESIRGRADGGDGELAAELERLGLTTVSV